MEMSAAEVSAGDMSVAAAPTAAAATEAMTASVSATMAAAMPTPMSASVAAATSAGGCKRWGEGDGSPEGCGGGDGDQSLSRHGGVILSGFHPPCVMLGPRSEWRLNALQRKCGDVALPRPADADTSCSQPRSLPFGHGDLADAR
jgi:hypothetical protein